MIRKKFIAIFFITALSCAETNTSSANGTVIKNTQTNINASQITLTLVGKATRTIFSFVNVYTLQLLVSDPSQFDTNQPLASLNNLQAVAIYITALRSVEKDRLKTSLVEALENNKIDLKRNSITKFINALNVTAKEGESFSIVGKRPNSKTELLEITVPGQTTPVVISESGIIRDIFSIWLGNTSHSSGLTKMKKQLLKGL